MSKGIFSIIENGVFKEGSIIKAMPQCDKKYNIGGCKKFYERLDNKEDGLYMCPSGYTVYKRTVEGECIFYCGMRVKNYCDRKKQFTQQDTIDNFILSQELFVKILKADDEMRRLDAQLFQEKEIHKDLLHDIRKLDGLVKNKAEEIIATYNDASNDNVYDILQRVRNIQAMEELISCKYSVYDLVSNIDILNVVNKNMISIYKKFDKARYILFDYRGKGITINFEGETEYTYNGSLIYFDILPFLLLENAVKYSPPNREVKVSFIEINGTLRVSVDSLGPYCPKEEIPFLFAKNYRSSGAQRVINEGNGIGLYLVKQICDQHGIEIDIETEHTKRINGIDYGYFTVNLLFDNHKSCLN